MPKKIKNKKRVRRTHMIMLTRTCSFSL